MIERRAHGMNPVVAGINNKGTANRAIIRLYARNPLSDPRAKRRPRGEREADSYDTREHNS